MKNRRHKQALAEAAGTSGGATPDQASPSGDPAADALAGRNTPITKTRFFNRTRVPNVVHQLIHTNVALREQVRLLQTELAKCKCRHTNVETSHDPLDLRL
eukprot:CAMPEP_0118923440 /NCGR_PEP_ID=MMETSP1169-20130426/1963_1 /TAXON_ID=36882 /ORGANISM="Pyramimonas obovata, Strain CCMP722" /LENGTH=100 /DNA_ID=CAMNT_0006864421 /DNA_START=417 /DNA_END=719 /DNA_ORIENTATION=+